MNNTAEFNHIDFVIVENQVLDKTSIRNDFRKYYERFTINNHINISDIESYVERSKKDYIVFFFEGIMFDFVTEYELFYNIQEEINSEGPEEWIIKGNIIDYMIDLRKKSKNFGKVYKFKLKEKDILYIPKGFAHGYLCFDNKNTILYLLNKKYSSKNNSGFNWKDKEFNIKWGIRQPILSIKDKKLGEYR